MVSWPKTNPQTVTDLDSHLRIPDNASSTNHIMYKVKYRTYYYATDNHTCDSCSSDQLSDNVTIDRDTKTPPGDETVTISKVRSGTYSFSVHNITDRDNSTDNYRKNLRQSGAKVKVIYCPVGADCSNQESVIRKKLHTPNANGTLWRVFTFNSSDSSGSGFTRVRDMTYEETPLNVY